ncbi:hypothetical protein [Clostridium cadaveris]|uniref:hypothetical protein n=1 Tax=Clostridium cadaveris TaxID=1529 RepID=UPI003993F1EA
MNKIIFKLKGFLGLCQCKKCWHRVYATISIKAIGKDIDVCEKHMKEILKDATLIGVE